MINGTDAQSNPPWKLPARLRVIFYLAVLPILEMGLLLALMTPWTTK